ncbi:MAG: GAF domain-containing sensor histidine kinase [Thermoanaerobaculia bacterium]
MTLRRLKLLGAIAPVAAVVALEVARYFLFGSVSMRQRLVTDAVVVVAILLFSAFIFRYVDKLQARLQRQNDELLALHSAGLDVSSELSLDVVLRKVVEQAKGLVGARYGALSVVDSTGRILSFITSGITTEQREAIGPPPVGHGLLGVVLREGQTLRLPNIAAHPQSAGFPPNHPPMKSLLGVPVLCKGPFLGNLYLTEKLGNVEFSIEDEETLTRFAVQAALAIDNAHLHEQAADLAVAQERLRISHEMHDGLAQILGYVNTKVQAAEGYLKRGNEEDAGRQLRELATAARQAYGDVRESIVGLRTLPEAQKPMVEVLSEYVARWQEMSGIPATLTLDPAVRLRARVELQLVRIVQEALTNVRKHSKARRVAVDVTRTNGTVVATVTDDGDGFDRENTPPGDFPQYGLATMRERAEGVGGRLSIESGPGQGTTVRCEVPWDGPGTS